MANKYLPIFYVSSKAYGNEANGVAQALASRFEGIRFGVSLEGSSKTNEFAAVHEFLSRSYPSPTATKPAKE